MPELDRYQFSVTGLTPRTIEGDFIKSEHADIPSISQQEIAGIAEVGSRSVKAAVNAEEALDELIFYGVDESTARKMVEHIEENEKVSVQSLLSAEKIAVGVVDRPASGEPQKGDVPYKVKLTTIDRLL